VGLSRRRWWWLALLAIVIAGGAAAFAVAGPPHIAVTSPWHTFITIATVVAAPASLLISVLALIVSRSQALSARVQAQYARDQTRYSAEQTRLAALATANAYRPILLPAHDAVPIGATASAEPHYPAIEPFTVPPYATAEGVFLVDPRQRRAVLRLRNVGSGPAILLPSSLTDYSGQAGELQGNPAIAAGEVERYAASVPSPELEAGGFEGPGSPALRLVWADLVSDGQFRERTFLLTLRYHGVAPNAEVEIVEAIFDPRGTGRWRTALTTEEPRYQDRGSGLLA
jgi:hypothetical protein